MDSSTVQNSEALACEWTAASLVPSPAFRRLQYSKAGRAWYIFPREHDVIEKWQNFHNKDATFCVLFNHLHVQRSVSMTPLARYVWYVTWYLRSSCCSETHVRRRFLPVFLPLSTLDVTHVRRCTRPSPLYRTASDEKLGVGLGMRLDNCTVQNSRLMMGNY